MLKLNSIRMIFGSILATIVIFIVGFIFQAVILGSHHKFFIQQGSVLAQPRDMSVIAHIIGGVTCGLILSFCYVVARKLRGPGALTAILSGLLVSLFTIGDMSAEFAFYNLGTMIPVMSFVNNVAGAIIASLVAAAVYKD